MQLPSRFYMTSIVVCGALSAVRPIAAGPPVIRDSQATLLADVRFDQRLDQPLPLDTIFRDENGRELPLQTWFGKRPVILALVYYRCPMLCTEVLNGLAKALLALDLSAGKDFEVVVVSIDSRETSALALAKKQHILRRYNRPQAAVGWHFLTGSQRNIEVLASAVGYGYRYDEKSSQFAHASGIIVATPEGRTARYFYGIDYPTRDLRLALVESGSGKIGSVVDQVLLYCFHYDPATGRYGWAIFRLLQFSGVATVAILVAFISISLWRDR